MFIVAVSKTRPPCWTKETKTNMAAYPSQEESGTYWTLKMTGSVDTTISIVYSTQVSHLTIKTIALVTRFARAVHATRFI